MPLKAGSQWYDCSNKARHIPHYWGKADRYYCWGWNPDPA